MPVVGGVVGGGTSPATMRRKKKVQGTLDTGLNSIPIVGALKNTLEVARGRDFFPDRFGPARRRTT
jgi:hypothetical protein